MTTTLPTINKLRPEYKEYNREKTTTEPTTTKLTTTTPTATTTPISTLTTTTKVTTINIATKNQLTVNLITSTSKKTSIEELTETTREKKLTQPRLLSTTTKKPIHKIITPLIKVPEIEIHSTIFKIYPKIPVISTVKSEIPGNNSEVSVTKNVSFKFL